MFIYIFSLPGCLFVFIYPINVNVHGPIFLDILHDPWEGLWVVEVDKFGPEEISKFIIVENETIKQESP